MPRRIGVVDQSSAGWTAAGIYSRMMLRSLDSVCNRTGNELYFLSSNELDDDQFCNAEWIELAAARSRTLKGEARLRHVLRLTDNSDPFSVARKHGIDVLLPLLDVPPWSVAPKLIGWIPDFQHVYLPEFFRKTELEKRNATIRRLAERANLIMLSSNAARADFVAFAPNAAEKARVLSFPSLLAFESLSDNPQAAVTKFNLPTKFALVANQFWAHKNHRVVVSAVAQLRDRGIIVPVVMTGLPADYRDPANSNLSTLLQAIAAAGLTGQITILGQIPYADLVSLMRTAAVIIQPSRFEGWSTIVQDAKALGRPAICSDISVHCEQALAAVGFFPCDQPNSLAEILATNWEAFAPGPNQDRESSALLKEREFAQQQSAVLLKICEEACS